jgi:nitrate/TMAO reductase-like tetraheme cytochrome c subunit
MVVWFGLWCLTPLSTIFQLYVAFNFIGGVPGENHQPVVELTPVKILCVVCHSVPYS